MSRNRDSIELQSLYMHIDSGQFCAEITVNFTQIFYSLLQVKNKNDHFHPFYFTQTDGVMLIWNLHCQFESKKKYENIIFRIGLSYNKKLFKALVRHTLQLLCDLSATKIHNDHKGRRGVATRFCSWSATDRGLVANLSATGRRPRWDLFASWCN